MRRVKHLIIALMVLVFGCANANALLRFGVKAGLNVNEMSLNEKVFDATNSCGWTAGVMAEFNVPVIGIGADLSVMYTRMNSKTEENISGTEQKLDKKGRNFIEIPLNLKYKLSLPAIESIIAPYVYTGPTLALKLDGGENSIFTTKTAQWGWNLGLGVQLVKHLQIGAGYTWGINNIVKKIGHVEASQVSDLKVKNNYWTITAAYLF